MKRSKQPGEATAWRMASWQGATREAMRRWAELPLEQILAAQEEMQELANEFGKDGDRSGTPDP